MCDKFAVIRRDRRPRRSVGIILFMCLKSRKQNVIFLILCKAIVSLGSELPRHASAVGTYIICENKHSLASP